MRSLTKKIKLYRDEYQCIVSGDKLKLTYIKVQQYSTLSVDPGNNVKNESGISPEVGHTFT